MLRIELKKSDLKRILRALDKINIRSTFWANEIGRLQSLDYTNELKVAILSEKYAPYSPYSKRYAAWKKKRYPYPGWWKLTRSLLGVIESRKVGNNWFAGVHRSATNKEGESIAEYAIKNEYGIERPERPVFRPTLIDYAPTGGAKRASTALKDISNAWS